MKKKSKLKKHFRQYGDLYTIISVELLIVFFFVLIWNGSRPLSEYTLEKTAIVVEDVHYVSGKDVSRLTVSADSRVYSFPKFSGGEYSNSKLSEMIKVGDELFISYYTEDGLFQSTNWIVDASTQTKVLRTAEEYIKDQKVGRVVSTVMFIIIEMLYLSGSVFYLWTFDALKIKKKLKKANAKKRKKSNP